MYSIEHDKTLLMALSFNKSVFARVHTQFTNVHVPVYHMEEITRTLLCIYRNCSLLQIGLSG